MKIGTLPLRAVIVPRLKANADLAAIIGGSVYDVAPPRRPRTKEDPGHNHTAIGPSQCVPWGDASLRGCQVTMQIDNWAEVAAARWTQFTLAERMNAAVSDCFPPLGFPAPVGWRLHGISVIDSRVLKDPDGLTCHGFVMVQAEMTPDQP